MKVLDFDWNLREVMAGKGLFYTTKLRPLLEEYGIFLSASQVYRLVTEKPERMNMQVLIALTEILGCELHDLIVPTRLGEATAESTGTEGQPAEAALDALQAGGHRPKRARIVPPTGG